MISKSGGTLETMAAYRAVRAEAVKFYGPKNEMFKKVIVPITAPRNSRLRDVVRADGFPEDDILTIPDDVGGRFGVAAIGGLLGTSRTVDR